MVKRLQHRFHILLRAVKLTKNADPDKHEYSGYGIESNAHSDFYWSDGSLGKIIIWC